MWNSANVWANPVSVLASAKDRRDIVEGLVPDKGIAWLYGTSMSFKTFIAMSIAQAASTGSGWMGRETERCLVVYVGAEGGLSLHARRAGAEIAAGCTGDLCVVTERPLLDTTGGQERLRGILGALLGLDGVSGPDLGVYENERCLKDEVLAVLVIVDTYSQTSSGDEKANVSAYIKGLRDLIEEMGENRLAFLVVDHATKSGGTYMGSVAKLNDVDSQLEVTRSGRDMRATLAQRKVKDGVESAPIVVELVEQSLEPFEDAYGNALKTLVVRDGTRAAKLASVAEGKAGVVLAILEEEGGRCDIEALRRMFAADGSNAEIKPDSVARAFRRAIDTLTGNDLVRVSGTLVELQGTGHD
jgi:hypothetical protein